MYDNLHQFLWAQQDKKNINRIDSEMCMSLIGCL